MGYDEDFTVQLLNNLPATKNGFCFIYVSNDDQNIPVYFDNLQVTHIRGPLLEENHYYPFGLTQAGISNKALSFGGVENKRKFVSQEMDDDLGLNWYQFKWRNHDPQIGRFIEIDPLADKYVYNSTYAYAENRPIDGIDLEGLEFFRKIGNFFSDVYYDGVLPAVDWFNHNVNFVYGAYNGIQSQFTGKDFLNGTPMTPAQGKMEFFTSVIPGGKIEGAVAKTIEKNLVKESAEAVEKQAAKTIDRDALQRGVTNEKKVLAEEGLEKNTKSMTAIDPKTGKEVTTIPDAMKNGATVDVKDVKKLYDSKQLRAQSTLSAQNGQKAIIYTGTDTHVSTTLLQRMDIQRRETIGPIIY